MSADYRDTIGYRDLIVAMKATIRANLFKILKMSELERKNYFEVIVAGTTGNAAWADNWISVNVSDIAQDAARAQIVNEVKAQIIEYFVTQVKALLETYLTIKSEPVKFEGTLPSFEGLNDIRLMYPDAVKSDKRYMSEANSPHEAYGLHFQPYGYSPKAKAYEYNSKQPINNSDWISHCAPAYSVDTSSPDCSSSSDGGCSST